MLKRLHRKRQRLQQVKQLQLLLQHQQLQRLLDLELILSQQVAQFLAHLVLEIILSQQVAQFHAHHNDHKEREHLVQEWQERVQVLCVQVLQRVQVHHDLQVLELEQVITHHEQVEHQHHQDHIVHKVQQVVHQVVQQVVHNVQAAAVLIAVQVVAVLQVHLERMQVNLQSVSRSHVKRCAKSSTICRHHNLVVLLFLMVMERQRFVCVAVLHSLTSQRRLVQIQQR
jgi:hypothetical protein